jgi:outer membrane protein TolC
LIIAQTNLEEQDLNLKTFFAKQLTGGLADAQIVATDPLPEPKPSDIPMLEDALHTALLSRPELPQAQSVLDNDRLALKLTRNSMLPTFNVYGYFAPAGLSGDSYAALSGTRALVQAGLPQSLAELIEGRFPEYACGFTLTIPLRNRSAIADNIRATMDEQQDEVALKRTANQVGVDVRNAISGLIQAGEQVAAAHEATQYAERDAVAERRKLDLGASTSYNVIVAQNNVLAAELAETQSQVAYAIALVELDQTEGVLLEKNHIDVEEALRGRILREEQRE